MRTLLVALTCIFGCAVEPKVYRHVGPDATIGPVVATSRASDRGGMRVLAQETRIGDGQHGLLAESQPELDELWSAVGLDGSSPTSVDFATHVVLGTNYSGGVCKEMPVAVLVDALGFLTFEIDAGSGRCILAMASVARVVAVPRKILGSAFIWKLNRGEAYAFDLAARSPRTVALRGRRTIATRAAIVTLPPVGHIELKTIERGYQVWVAHHAADDITVIAGETGEGYDVRTRVIWDEASRRFTSGHDSHGRSDQGTRLPQHEHERVGDDRLIIGILIASHRMQVTNPAPPTSTVSLIGPSAPYEMPAASFGTLPSNTIAVVDADLVWGLDGPARLCQVPTNLIERSRFAGCPENAPTYYKDFVDERAQVEVVEGPLAILRFDNRVGYVIALGDGHRERWTVMPPDRPAVASGATRSKGPIKASGMRRGDTTGATNGFEPPCVAAGARGSADESWQLASSSTRAYTIELVARHQAVLAVVGADGAVLACIPRDRIRSSVAQVHIAAGSQIRIIVDGEHRDAGPYELRVREVKPAPALMLGVEVAGDTSSVPNGEVWGECDGQAGQREFTFEVETQGNYLFRIDTPGWTGMIGINDKRDGYNCSITGSPYFLGRLLTPGTYHVVIDGRLKENAGPFKLRVDRCLLRDQFSCSGHKRPPVPGALAD